MVELNGLKFLEQFRLDEPGPPFKNEEHRFVVSATTSDGIKVVIKADRPFEDENEERDRFDQLMVEKAIYGRFAEHPTPNLSVPLLLAEGTEGDFSYIVVTRTGDSIQHLTETGQLDFNSLNFQQKCRFVYGLYNSLCSMHDRGVVFGFNIGVANIFYDMGQQKSGFLDFGESQIDPDPNDDLERWDFSFLAHYFEVTSGYDIQIGGQLRDLESDLRQIPLGTPERDSRIEDSRRWFAEGAVVPIAPRQLAVPAKLLQTRRRGGPSDGTGPRGVT